MKRRYPLLLLLLLLLPATLWVLDRVWPLRLPDANRGFARVVLDRNGRPLRAFADAQGVWRYPVTPDAVSPWYLQALLGYEDRGFYWHPGVNPAALIRAAWQNMRNRRIVSGGSTLTMQVARLLYPQKRSLMGKLRQILRALQLEYHLTKQEILTLYLNRAPFGGTVEGIAAASHAYLQKSPRDLTRAEAALLAVLPQAPSRLRPDRHPRRAQRARDKVLDRLAALGVWPPDVIADARREVVAGYGMRHPMQAPLLARRLAQQFPSRSVIATTLDRRLQAGVQLRVKRYVDRLPPRSSAAVLVVENHGSEVRAYVGSADFLDAGRYGQVDMIKAVRSPGSTLKPFLYGLALDAGLIHSESLLSDAPRIGRPYRPTDFARGFAGPVSVSQALQQSLNVPAVDLLEHLGPSHFLARLVNAGLAPRLPPDAKANLSMVLGGVGVTLESLVSGYLAFSHSGYASRPRLRPEQQAARRRLLSPGAAWIVRDILRRTPRPGRLHPAGGDRHHDIAWKTGTSYGYRDSWAIGTNADYTIGVWVGRPDGTPMPGYWGGKTAAPLMFQIFRLLPAPASTEDDRPANVEKVTICWPLGTALDQQPTSTCHRQKKAWVLNHQIPPTLPDPAEPYQSNPVTYWINPRTGRRVDATCPVAQRVSRTVALWPVSVEPWVPASQRAAARIPPSDPACPEPLPRIGARLRIVGLQPGSRLRSPDPGKWPVVKLKTRGGNGRIHWYIDGRSAGSYPAGAAITPAFTRAGEYQIVAIDDQGASDKLSFVVLGN